MQLDVLLDLLLENNHDTYAYHKMINVIKCNTKSPCRKIKHALGYLLKDILKHLCRFKEELLRVPNVPYQRKLPEKGVFVTVRLNKKYFTSYGDHLDGSIGSCYYSLSDD